MSRAKRSKKPKLQREKIVAMFVAMVNAAPPKLLEYWSACADTLIAFQLEVHTNEAAEALQKAGAA